MSILFLRFMICAFVVSSIGLFASPCPGELLQIGSGLKRVEVKCERIYFDPDDFPLGEESFHIHVGENTWIETTTVHRDMTGFFTYSADVFCVPGSLAYQKQWKCPYCNRYWPMGQPCRNEDCPSRFK